MQSEPSSVQDTRRDTVRSNRGESPPSQGVLRRAQKESRRLARAHYENFLVATVLLPGRLRQPFYDVYAFCRRADDLADESPSPEQALRSLDDFEQQLRDAFADKPQDDLFISLADTIKRFDLSAEPFEQLLDAFRQDQHKRRYATFDELQDYCRRSANPVGRILLQLGGCLDAQTAELSDQICTGLQLANCWQDVERDFKIGRIYLPQDEMVRHGVDEKMLTASSTPAPLRRLLREQCERTRGFFERGIVLGDRVPRWLSADVRLFAHGGLATLEAIERIDYDVLAKRPRVGKPRQLWMLARAAVGLL